MAKIQIDKNGKALTLNGKVLGITDNYTGLMRENINGIFSMPKTSFVFSLPEDITGIGAYSLYYAFNGCEGVTKVNLSNIKTINGDQALRYAFNNCHNLIEVDLSNLTTITGYETLYYAFYYCENLANVNFNSLTTIDGRYALSCAFRDCKKLTSLSFPALRSDGFGRYTNQFNDMLSGVTECTVHFPSNLEAVIGEWADVTKGFGGTNTTVLFDLAATA